VDPYEDRVLLAHGSGGRMSHALVSDLFLRHLSDPILNRLEDAAVLGLNTDGSRIAFTTDSYVVRPLFFPGGNIGKLAICGTVNDLAMRGARPLYLSAGFILEEGLPLSTLERIVIAMAETAEQAGVRVVAGDTKVVEKGSGDGVYINTAGIGIIPPGREVFPQRIQPGDAVLVSGAVGDHGLAIMTQREGLAFEGQLRSDCAPLAGLVEAMFASGAEIHALRDPTRGGLATTLNELAHQAGVRIEIQEDAIPIHEPVQAASELLGLDPLYVANEGKLVAIVAGKDADMLLQAMRAHPLGREAAHIGQVAAEPKGQVVLKTLIGTWRLLDMLSGEQLPRIC